MSIRSLLCAIIIGMLFGIGCRGPIATHVYSHPIISGVDVKSVQDGNDVWLELTIPHESTSEQWSTKFDDEVPERLKVLPGETHTRFKWIISPNKVKMLGTPGYGLSVINLKDVYHLTITVRPNYSVFLETVGGAIR